MQILVRSQVGAIPPDILRSLATPEFGKRYSELLGREYRAWIDFESAQFCFECCKSRPALLVTPRGLELREHGAFPADQLRSVRVESG